MGILPHSEPPRLSSKFVCHTSRLIGCFKILDKCGDCSNTCKCKCLEAVPNIKTRILNCVTQTQKWAQYRYFRGSTAIQASRMGLMQQADQASRIGLMQASMSAVLVIIPMMSGKDERSSSSGMLAFRRLCLSHSFWRVWRLFKNAGEPCPTDSVMSHISLSDAYLQSVGACLPC